jgi:glutaredoxin
VSFLYKHYEKIILAFFLLVFVSALVYLIIVFSKSKDITEKDLMIRPEGKNYVPIFYENQNEIKPKGERGAYSLEDDLKNEPKWGSSTKRNPQSIAFTDLLIPFQAARCDKCKELIPCAAFAMKKCPICKADPGEVKKPAVDYSKFDSDKDGIPDKLEKELKLNPRDPRDKWTDLDEDGFPNVTEFEAETKLNDPKSHPPLADKLKLLGLKRKKLALLLVDVKERGKKENWVIQIKTLNRRGKFSTEFKKIGDSLKLDKEGRQVYTIVDAKHKMDEVFDKKLNRPIPQNVSEITIQNVLDKNDKPIIVTVGNNVYENKIKVGFKDSVTGKVYVLKNGSTFNVGDTNTGNEEYTVISVSDVNKVSKEDAWAEIKLKDGKSFKITGTSAIDKVKAENGIGNGQINNNKYDRRVPGFDMIGYPDRKPVRRKSKQETISDEFDL